VRKAPLGVALLAQTPGLGVVARLDWRLPHPIRICINSVNRPWLDERDEYFGKNKIHFGCTRMQAAGMTPDRDLPLHCFPRP
jgi:hypothetical protein